MTALRLTGGTIRTMDPGAPVAREVLVDGGRIVARTRAPATELDLRGRCVLPGLNDAHVHFPTWSAAQRQVPLEGARTVAEAMVRGGGGRRHGRGAAGPGGGGVARVARGPLAARAGLARRRLGGARRAGPDHARPR